MTSCFGERLVLHLLVLVVVLVVDSWASPRREFDDEDEDDNDNDDDWGLRGPPGLGAVPAPARPC